MEATIKKLTHEYVQAQTLPFEAWDWNAFKEPVKVMVVKYDLADGASIKTIVFRRPGEVRQLSRSSVDFLYQDEQSVLNEMAEAEVQSAERPEYDELLEQRDKLFASLYDLLGSYVPCNDENYKNALEAMRFCKLNHREDRLGFLK